MIGTSTSATGSDAAMDNITVEIATQKKHPHAFLEARIMKRSNEAQLNGINFPKGGKVGFSLDHFDNSTAKKQQNLPETI